MGRHHGGDSGTNILLGFSLAAVGVGILWTLLTGQWLHWLPILAAVCMGVKIFGRHK